MIRSHVLQLINILSMNIFFWSFRKSISREKTEEGNSYFWKSWSVGYCQIEDSRVNFTMVHKYLNWVGPTLTIP